METSFQMHVPRKAFLEIIQMHKDVIKLSFNKLCPMSKNNSSAKFHLSFQVWEERDHAKTKSKKTLLYVVANKVSPYLLRPTATLVSNSTNPTTNNIPLSKMAFYHTVLSVLPSRCSHFLNSRQLYIKYLPLAIKFAIGNGNSITRHILGKYCQAPQ